MASFSFYAIYFLLFLYLKGFCKAFSGFEEEKRIFNSTIFWPLENACVSRLKETNIAVLKNQIASEMNDLVIKPSKSGRKHIKTNVRTNNKKLFDRGSGSFLKSIRGTWISERCEVRPGPTALLRRYSFRPYNKFLSHQYHYKDTSCIIPYYFISAEGWLCSLRSSWLIPGSFEADEPKINKIVIVPYSKRAANRLANIIATFCNETIKTKSNGALKRFQFIDDSSVEDRLGSYFEENSSIPVINDSHYAELKETKVECVLRSLNWSFAEFQLLRNSHEDGKSLLRLGSSKHISSSKTIHYRPTYFEEALHRVSQVAVSSLGRQLFNARFSRPPLLKSQYHVPFSLIGAWSSKTCEINSEAVFMKRTLIFDHVNDHTEFWISKYTYFKDPKCKEIVFNLWLNGDIAVGNESSILLGSRDVTITTKGAFIEPKDSGFLENLKNTKCSQSFSSNTWYLNKTVNLTPFGGCAALNVQIPRTQYDVAKTEISSNGEIYLYFGQRDEDQEPEISANQRPTSFGIPLVSCKTKLYKNEVSFNKVHQMSQAFTYILPTSSASKLAVCKLWLYLSIIIYHKKYLI